MPRTSVSPNAGDTTTGRSRATISPSFRSRTVALRAWMRPFAVLSTIGIRLSLTSSDAAAAVSVDNAVRVAPLSTSMRRFTPSIVTFAQKCPSADILMRVSSPTTFWSSSFSSRVTYCRYGSNRSRSVITTSSNPAITAQLTSDKTTRNTGTRRAISAEIGRMSSSR
ncbi:hypothetical protein WR25_01470 [Diploscapter pachys]|uniref:Uncharacterized protein n=1 Tax=Diploscapter pachys TaxID=2018661 RepID=A0A2A2K2E1_9BILA|nr:hypothetical protein WR25_01470 [Diploscapter pachys]